MGTPEFAVPSLTALYAAGLDIVGVFTRPDKPRGRGMKTYCTPVADAAEKLTIPVFKPEGFKDGTATELLRSLSPDIVAVVAYGRILPQDALDIPRLGCVNAHASLLPLYRGAAPIQWSVVNGEKTTGITTMHMSRGLDEGDMIYAQSTDISDDETGGDLHDRLMHIAASLLVRTIADIGQGTAPRAPQPHELATFAPIIKKQDGLIDWTKRPYEIVNLIRGMNPWPSAFTTIGGNQIRILKAIDTGLCNDAVAGTVIAADSHQGLIVASSGGSVKTLQLQPVGGKSMSASDYLRGHSIDPGTTAGI